MDAGAGALRGPRVEVGNSGDVVRGHGGVHGGGGDCDLLGVGGVEQGRDDVVPQGAAAPVPGVAVKNDSTCQPAGVVRTVRAARRSVLM